MSDEFLELTAKDYDIPFWRVKEIYRLSDSLEDFYQRLETAVKDSNNE
jgi:hypothetical protein